MNARRVPILTGPHWLQASPLVAKEFHAILPLALLGALLCGVSSQAWAGAIFPMACAAIAAQSAGHDFSNRTLASLLSQPVSRVRIWLLKLSLIAAAATALGLVTAATMLRGFHFGAHWVVFPASFILDPIVNAICLAPALTLFSRSALFGTVFTIALPFALSAIIQFGCNLLGYGDRQFDPRYFQNFILIPLWIAGAVVGWRKFVTLEVIEGNVGKAVARARGAERGVTVGNPLWQLIKKELMVQRLPIGLSVFGMALTLFLNADQTQLWTMVYLPIVVLLAGAISSADERSMGTVQWQTLLPIPFWKQWVTKISVTYFVALIFGALGPGSIALAKDGKLYAFMISTESLRAIPWFVFSTLLVVALTVYVSTICETGLRAMLAAGGVLLAFGTGMTWAVGIYLRHLQEKIGADVSMHVDLTAGPWISQAIMFSMMTGLSVLIFWLAMQNHRSADRFERRIAAQCLAVVSVAAVAIFVMFTMM